MPTIHCDACQKQMTAVLKMKPHEHGVQETYFICPHCGKRYTAYYTDKAIRKKQAKLNKIKVGEKWHKLHEDIKLDMRVLRHRMEV